MEPISLKVSSMPNLRRDYQVSPRYIHERLCLNMSTIGNLKKLKKLYKESVDTDDSINWGAVSVTASKYGHIEILRWIREFDPTEIKYTLTPNFWVQEIPAAAAEYSRIMILDWLFEFIKPEQLHSDVTAAAVKGGHLELLKWLLSKNVCWGPRCCSNAVEYQRHDILAFLRTSKPRCPWDSDTCSAAAKIGDLKMLQLLKSYESEYKRCRWDHWTCARAAEYGHLEILKWARSRGCKWSHWTCTLASRNGHLNILRWCQDQPEPCDWNEATCSSAASGDHFEVLIYLRTGTANGIKAQPNFKPCPWNKSVTRASVAAGSLRILRWSLINGCDWDYHKCKDLAKSRENSSIFNWIKTEGNQFNTSQ